MKKLFALFVTLSTSLSIFGADYMYLKLKDGGLAKYNVSDIEEAFFREESSDTTIVDPEQGGLLVVDDSETPLKFTITSDSTVEVTNDYSYSILDSITVPAKVRIDGIVYTVTGIGKTAFAYFSNLTNIELPSTLTSIGQSSFDGCAGLQNIKIPSSVRTIEERAFNDCSGLLIVDIPSGVNYIGEYAFCRCHKLQSIEIPSTVTKIGKMAFFESNAVTPRLLIYDNGKKCYGWVGDAKACVDIKIPEGVEEIGSYAIPYGNGLTSLEIPSSVTKIEKSAFSYCTGVKADLLIYDNGTKCYGWLGDNDLCTDVVIPDGVKEIGDEAFYYCTKMTNIEIPSSVTQMGDFAFYNCYNLESVAIPSSVISIGNNIFDHCSALQNVSLSSGLKNIGISAFSNCFSMESIEIPSSVTFIGEKAFLECTRLNVVIDNSKENVMVETDSFAGCKSVTYLK